MSNFDSSASLAIDNRFDTSDVITVVLGHAIISPEPRRKPKRRRGRKPRAARAAWRDQGDAYER